jgi:hypothetical protein
MFRLSIAVLTALLFAQSPVHTTTYPPVSFDDLVTKADVIFIGEVTDVRPFPQETPDGTIIKTRVIFRVSDPIWGTTSILEVFDFLGGEWEGVTMQVAEMPEFAIGDRRVVFARRARSINPIVGFTQGLLEIRRDGGVDRVFTLGGLPLESPEDIGVRSPDPSGSPTTPIPLSEFRDRISLTLAETGRR